MSKRIQDLASPLKKRRNTVRQNAVGLLANFSVAQKFWFGFAILCILTTFLISNPLWRASGEQIYKEGDIARESIISPADISSINVEETEGIRQSARETVKPIFTFEANRSDEAVQSFRSAWESLQRKIESSNANVKTNVNLKTNINAKNGYNAKTDTLWNGAGGEKLGETFAARVQRE